jgi:quercetin dioxygenase-like cupin family protein
MDADKVPTIVESALSNGGKRTLVDSELAKGAHAPPHFHKDFQESFTLISGSMTVWTSEDMNEEGLKPIELEVGKTVHVPPNTLHKFLVNEQSRINCVFTPGMIGFERILLIMRGTQEDGLYQQFSTPHTENGAMFYSILADLTNSHFVGEAKTRLDAFQAANGPEIEKTKAELIAKYASDEHLKKVAGI